MSREVSRIPVHAIIVYLQKTGPLKSTDIVNIYVRIIDLQNL